MRGVLPSHLKWLFLLTGLLRCVGKQGLVIKPTWQHILPPDSTPGLFSKDPKISHPLYSHLSPKPFSSHLSTRHGEESAQVPKKRDVTENIPSITPLSLLLLISPNSTASHSHGCSNAAQAEMLPISHVCWSAAT